ncbi:MAG: hypothetical protein LBR73_02990 [Oscillospiraceae bacterium]|jgi:hypothetical protein|nr:hypothetical protein [Oscillospiraceae bacterium]
MKAKRILSILLAVLTAASLLVVGVMNASAATAQDYEIPNSGFALAEEYDTSSATSKTVYYSIPPNQVASDSTAGTTGFAALYSANSGGSVQPQWVVTFTPTPTETNPSPASSSLAVAKANGLTPSITSDKSVLKLTIVPSSLGRYGTFSIQLKLINHDGVAYGGDMLDASTGKNYSISAAFTVTLTDESSLTDKLAKAQEIVNDSARYTDAYRNYVSSVILDVKIAQGTADYCSGTAEENAAEVKALIDQLQLVIDKKDAAGNPLAPAMKIYKLSGIDFIDDLLREDGLAFIWDIIDFFESDLWKGIVDAGTWVYELLAGIPWDDVFSGIVSAVTWLIGLIPTS